MPSKQRSGNSSKNNIMTQRSVTSQEKSKQLAFYKQVSEGLQTNQGSAPRFLIFSDESGGE